MCNSLPGPKQFSREMAPVPGRRYAVVSGSLERSYREHLPRLIPLKNTGRVRKPNPHLTKSKQNLHEKEEKKTTKKFSKDYNSLIMREIVCKK